jgi:threonine dehydrogenase-like Zn-dependent dehydrogenase
MTWMLNARFLGEQRIEIERSALPEPGPGEVRVRVSRCALCGSDNRLYRAGSVHVPGHEIVGLVDAPGHARHGERVLVYIPVFCGTCETCLRGDTHQCPHIVELVGWQRPGGFAEALCVPERNLIPVPDDISTDLAPLLLDTIGTAAHAIRLAKRVVDGGRAIVFGAGPLGLGLVLALQRLGFPEITCVEPVAKRRAIAAAFGAEPREPGAVTGRFDAAFEASGNHDARLEALHAVAPYGVAVFLGESDRPWTIPETKPLRRKDFYALRSFYFPLSEVEASADLLRADADRYRTLVDHRFALSELPAAYAAFARGELLKPEVAFGPEAA